MQRCVFLLLLLCCLWLKGRLQERQNIFFHYNQDNSGYNESIMTETFAQESRGILWLGSRNGLARFDGNNFRYFKADASDSTSITGNNIACLYLDKGSMLYVGTYSSGIFCMDPLTLKARKILLPGEKKGMAITVTMIAPIGRDSLILSTGDGQLLMMHRNNSGTRQLYKEKDASSPAFKKCLPALHLADHFWLLSDDAITLLDIKTGSVQEKTFSVEELKEKVKITDLSSFYIQNDSIAWITAFYHGLIEWNYRNDQYFLHSVKTSLHTAAVSHINDITTNNTSGLWLATSQQGIINFDISTRKFTVEAGYHSGSARAFFRDHNNGTWISSANDIGYHHNWYSGFAGVSPSAVNKDDRLLFLKWINNRQAIWSTGTKNKTGLFNSTNYQSAELKHKNQDVGGFHSATLLNDHWVFKSVGQGFYQFAPNNKELELFRPGVNDSVIQALKINGIAPTRSGFLFTSSKGIVITDSVNKLLSIHKKSPGSDSLFSNFFKEPLTDKYGRTWLAGLDGICVYDPTAKTFKQLRPATDKKWSGLDNVSGMKFSRDGNKMFVATRGAGIFVLDTRTYELLKRYNENNILPGDQLLHIGLSNQDSLIWVASQRSISSINVYSNEVRTWDAFNSALRFNNRGYAFDVSGEGVVITGDSSINLLTNTEKYRVSLYPFISYFKGAEECYTAGNVIHLEKDQRHAEIFIACNWLADQRNLLYEYRLSEKEGWLKAERGRILLPDIRNGNTAVFTRVTLSGPVSGVGYGKFIVHRELFFYQSFWFIIPVIGFIIFLIYLLLRSRNRKKQEKQLLEKKLQELAIAFLRSRLNPHFIFNTLSSLRYLVLSGDNDKASHYILRLSKLLRMVLQQSETQTSSIEDEVILIDLYLQLEALRFNNEFEYTIKKVNEPLFDIRLPSLILQPFVENALRHGLSGSRAALKKIEIIVEYLSVTSAKILISDNGVGLMNSGRTASPEHQSVGLKLTHERIIHFNNMHPDKIEWKISEAEPFNTANPGTVVEIFYRKFTPET